MQELIEQICSRTRVVAYGREHADTFSYLRWGFVVQFYDAPCDDVIVMVNQSIKRRTKV